ncbi:MAG: TrmH family RNA methyltransferase, partial [Bacteroidetes bacterium]
MIRTYKTVEEFKAAPKHPILLVLDNIRSLNNVGSFFRTADSFLLEKIYLCGITGKPPHREIEKTALGATLSVDWEYYSDTADVIKKLQDDNYRIIAVEQHPKSISLQNIKIENNEKIALVFGNEVTGLSENIISLCSEVVEVPQMGTKHSLNVAV